MNGAVADQIRLQQCGQCGKRVPATARFCPRCGTRLRPGGLPGENTYAAVSKALKSRSTTRNLEPLVIPRAVMPAAKPPATPVLAYEPPRSKQPPPPPPPKPKNKGTWVWIGLGLFIARSVATMSTGSHDPPSSYTPPVKFYVPPPPPPAAHPFANQRDADPLTHDTFPGGLESPTIAPRPPQSPESIPGTSLSLDERGHVVLTKPQPPAPPPPPSAPAPPSHRAR